MKYDIFISYRRDGGYETARHLYDLLRLEGYSVSFDLDTLRNGDFDEQLFQRIEDCNDFILILNKGAFDRSVNPEFNPKQDWMRQELACALKNNKNIIPIMLPGFDSFPDNLPEDIVGVIRKNGPKHSQEYFDEFYNRLKKLFILSKPGRGTKSESEETKQSKYQKPEVSKKETKRNKTSQSTIEKKLSEIGNIECSIEGEGLQIEATFITAVSRRDYCVTLYFRKFGEEEYSYIEPFQFTGTKNPKTIEFYIDKDDLGLEHDEVTPIEISVDFQEWMKDDWATIEEYEFTVNIYHYFNIFSKNTTEIRSIE